MFMIAQTVKNLPAVQANRVPSLGWEDPLEKEMENHSSILAWKILRTEEPDGLQFMGSQRVWQDRATDTFTLSWMGSLTTVKKSFLLNLFYSFNATQSKPQEDSF